MKLGVIMDPIGGINVKKDSTLAMLLAAQKRGWDIRYMELPDIYVEEGTAMCSHRSLEVEDDPDNWFSLGAGETTPIADLDVVLMRKDPPFDMEYIYATYILELATKQGALVVNNPPSLRDANEKMFITYFPQCIVPTLVSRDQDLLRQFVSKHGDSVLKPLDGMGGSSIFQVKPDDLNMNVIIESLSDYGKSFVMAQRFIPDIDKGDKRILLIDGKPVDYALARVPPAGEFRGNLAAGGQGVGVELSERDRWICEQVAPVLKEKGLIFVGLDVIGDYLTEINVTSPTCIRELDQIYGIDIAALLMDSIESKLNALENG